MAGLLDLSTLNLPGMNGNPGLLGVSPPPTAPAPAATGTAPVAQAMPTSSILDSVFAPPSPPTPHVMTGADRLNLLGATLRDVSSSLRGGEATALPAAEQAIQSEGASSAPAAKGAKAAKGTGQPADSSLLYSAAKNLFPGDPKAQFLFATGNTDFLKNISERGYGFHTAEGGSSYTDPTTGQMVVAPKLVDNQGQYGTQTGDGYTGTGTSAPSIQQQADTANAATAAAKAADDARHNKAGEGIDLQKVGIEGGQLGVAKQHLGIDQNELALHQQQFGHASNPLAPIVHAQADYDKLPSGQHIQYVAPDGSLRIKP